MRTGKGRRVDAGSGINGSGSTMKVSDRRRQ
jgi:hypothetical protein